MKEISIIFVLIFSISVCGYSQKIQQPNKKKNDLEKIKLKGKVKSVKKTIWKAEVGNNDINKGEMMFDPLI
ncbi:MAG: hypothetical protein Q8880_03015, partial [Bacteroidota bacterium]|nr:hypothetical protein [Bacteroidota bacterium]